MYRMQEKEVISKLLPHVVYLIADKCVSKPETNFSGPSSGDIKSMPGHLHLTTNLTFLIFLINS